MNYTRPWHASKGMKGMYPHSGMRSSQVAQAKGNKHTAPQQTPQHDNMLTFGLRWKHNLS